MAHAMFPSVIPLDIGSSPRLPTMTIISFPSRSINVLLLCLKKFEVQGSLTLSAVPNVSGNPDKQTDKTLRGCFEGGTYGAGSAVAVGAVISAFAGSALAVDLLARALPSCK
jgi:hypothetical protein